MYGMIKPNLSKRFSVHIPLKMSFHNRLNESSPGTNSNSKSMNDLDSSSFVSSIFTPKKIGIGKRSNIAITSESSSFASKRLDLKIKLKVDFFLN
jgi:hypothetical protein